MDKVTDRIVVGRFGRPHGIKGFITVHSFTDPRDNILRYTDWHAYINKRWQPLKLLRVEVNEKFILAQVEGYSEREQVAALTNTDIAVSRDQLPPLEEGEFYWHDLIGMKVVNQQGILLGTVVEIMPTGANDVLVVEGEKRYLVPYLPGQFVADINTSQQLITVDWDADF
ncbi:ribosome maturation factor RimM [Legionella hackeliae]|uniref:Ribosome maturation factor RimM n=1 Tax=Legionella hackeliae TaxID=449 RepID=A0A0A8US19_LEGHA|nr:ribosome maturation factor RimM [Legionella hackeliae]KTD14820.1 16S rRNA processing protein RimM [Legionella hackeliae]CEK09554.1 Ribosome maturation factor rimM [Legionella hackeliae]STX49464.1 16S rRNA processing protein RimM [Legionella hackeliae]